MRSPGRSSLSLMDFDSVDCSAAVRGNVAPHEAYACCTSPEQSKLSGPVPGSWEYGFEIWSCANFTAVVALAGPPSGVPPSTIPSAPPSALLDTAPPSGVPPSTDSGAEPESGAPASEHDPL